MGLLRPNIDPSQENLAIIEEVVQNAGQDVGQTQEASNNISLDVYSDKEIEQLQDLSKRPSFSTQASLADAGFEGLELGSRSFPMISLKNDGLFEDSDGISYGKKFHCRVLSSRSKTVIQANPIEDNKKDVLFSYDNITSTSGLDVRTWEAEKVAQGKRLERREYTDVLVIMDASGEDYDEEMRILSVAPKSRERLGGKIQALAIRKNWGTQQLMENIREFTLTCECGAKVLKAQQPFYPWSFAFSK